jgi:hypothetical protein
MMEGTPLDIAEDLFCCLAPFVIVDPLLAVLQLAASFLWLGF